MPAANQAALESVADLGAAVGRRAILVLLMVAMVAVVIAVDVRFFRDRFAARLAANIGIVFVFVVVYFAFLRPA